MCLAGTFCTKFGGNYQIKLLIKVIGGGGGGGGGGLMKHKFFYLELSTAVKIATRKFHFNGDLEQACGLIYKAVERSQSI